MGGEQIGKNTTLLFVTTHAGTPEADELAVRCRTRIAAVGKRGLENADPALQMDKLPGRIGKVGTMTLNI